MRLLKGPFSKLRSALDGTQEELGLLDVFLETFALIAVADGVLEEEEKLKVNSLIMEYLDGYSVKGSTPMERFTAYTDELLELKKTPEPFRQRMEAICDRGAALAPKWRAMLLVMVNSIAEQGGLTGGERAVLARLKSALS